MEEDRILVVAVEDGKAAEPWVQAFRARLPGWAVLPLDDAGPQMRASYAVVWRHPPGALAAMNNLRAIFSLGAGVDHVLADPNLPDGVPIARVVAPDLTARMSEWVVLHVLAHHRQYRRYVAQQRERRWEDDRLQPAAKDVRVGVMGLGVLGHDSALKLRRLGFDVAGWSRTPKFVDGIRTFAGEQQLAAFLAHAQILVVLLPLTPATRGVLNAGLFRGLARDGYLGGPVLLNAGRGGLQVENDILRCLDDGTLHAVTLDVFENEPLAQDSALWAHPRVTITPHNAAISNPDAVADLIAAQIQAHESGEPLDHLVDPSRAY